MKISSVASVNVKDSVLTEVRLTKYHSVLDNKSIRIFGVKELQKCTEASGAICFLTLSQCILAFPIKTFSMATLGRLCFPRFRESV